MFFAPLCSCFVCVAGFLVGVFFFHDKDEMGEARSVMRTLKEERDEIRGQLDAMQVRARAPTIDNVSYF